MNSENIEKTYYVVRFNAPAAYIKANPWLEYVLYMGASGSPPTRVWELTFAIESAFHCKSAAVANRHWKTADCYREILDVEGWRAEVLRVTESRTVVSLDSPLVLLALEA